MNRILLVDDDPLLLTIYQTGLARHGFAVEAVPDGLSAIQILRSGIPDLVVLDLMMPKFAGTDVLRFIRSEPRLAELPVIVLSNAFLGKLGREAMELGAARALLKVNCTPQSLAVVIREVLEAKGKPEAVALQRPIPNATSAGSPQPAAVPPAPQPPPVKSPSQGQFNKPSVPGPSDAPKASQDLEAKVRADFLSCAETTCSQLRHLSRDFGTVQNEAERGVRLAPLYNKVRFTAAAAGLARCHQIAHLGSALEALLFEALAKPSVISPSMVQTITSTVDFLTELFKKAGRLTNDQPVAGLVLIVDDDPMFNRLARAALGQANMQSRSTESPLVALDWLAQGQYDMVLLDIQMPGMDGFEFCKRLRELPNYRDTPVIFVTSHADFDNRIKSLSSGGNDFISKPVFPLELAVKAVTQLLLRQFSEAKN
jgi:CheY-like chemotaxis protein